jgi:multidrug efflux pump subunit AcrB
VQELIREMSMKAAENIREGLVLAFNPPAISGLGTTGGFELYVQNRGQADSAYLAQVTQQLIVQATKAPELAGLSTTFRPTVPQLYVELDRERAKAYGVPITSVFDTLQALFGSLYVNDFNQFGRTYRVQLQAEPEFRSSPGDIGRVYVRSTKGEMIPLSSLLTVREITGPDTIERYLNFPAAKIIGRDTVRGRRLRQWSGLLKKHYRRISLLPGPVKRSRKRKVAARRESCLARP